MRFSFEPRGEPLHAACGEHGCPKILTSIRASRPLFKPEDYGIASYVSHLDTARRARVHRGLRAAAEH